MVDVGLAAAAAGAGSVRAAGAPVNLPPLPPLFLLEVKEEASFNRCDDDNEDDEDKSKLINWPFSFLLARTRL